MLCTVIILVITSHYSYADFHQDDYEIIQDRLYISDSNKTYIKDVAANVTNFSYNDTTQAQAINLNGYFLQEITESAMLYVMVYKYVSDEYRPFPINVSMNICEEYKKMGERNPFGIRTAIQMSNFRGCPFKKNKLYHLYNWILEQEKFPPHLPPGNYSLNIIVHGDNDYFLASGRWFGSLVAKKKKKKNRRRH